MEDLDMKRWVVPFYLDFLHGGFTNIRSAYSIASSGQRCWPEWSELLRHELRQISPEIAGDLIMDCDWRPQICGGYFCGLNQWEEFIVPIGHRLVAKKNVFCTQGYAFALARMPSHASANYLCGYLSRVGQPQDAPNWYGSDLEWVVAALQWVDEQMGTHRLEPYVGSLVVARQKERFKQAIQLYREVSEYSLLAPHVSAKQIEEILQQQEKELDTYFLPDDGSRKSEWFWKLMAFCQEHFDAPAR